jgi:hypothetical protein
LTANGVVGTPAVVAPLRNGLARGRLGVGGLGFGLIDRERAVRPPAIQALSVPLADRV